jgi:hypothetical protein
VAKELVPLEVLQRLHAVRGLAKGRTQARDTDPVKPVDETNQIATASLSKSEGGYDGQISNELFTTLADGRDVPRWPTMMTRIVTALV